MNFYTLYQNTFDLYSAADWWLLAAHFLSLSLLSIGGAITLASEMQRTLSHQYNWLSDTQFVNAITFAQIAPGPNILFVALIGWYVGFNASGGNLLWGGTSALLALAGIMLPSSVLVYRLNQWAQSRAQAIWLRAFKQGMTPIVIALMLATAWSLSSAQLQSLTAHQPTAPWVLVTLTIASALLAWRTRLPMLLLLGIGAFCGVLWA